METLELQVIRKHKKEKYTIGDFLVENAFYCNTLEDTVRDFGPDGKGKIFGQTAIPEGRYEVTIGYSKKFENFYPVLINVPYYSGVMIHSGVDQEDTEGCILLGVNNEVGKVHGGRPLVRNLVTQIRLAKIKGLKTFITITSQL